MFHLLHTGEYTPTEFATYFSEQIDPDTLYILMVTPLGKVIVFAGIGEPALTFQKFPFLVATFDLTTDEFGAFMEESQSAILRDGGESFEINQLLLNSITT